LRYNNQKFLGTKTLESKDLKDDIEIQNKIFFGEEVIEVFKMQLMVVSVSKFLLEIFEIFFELC
jgi:hypothetical protein